MELGEVAVDCCITKAPCGGEKAGRSPVDRAKRGIKRSVAVDARGIPLGVVTALANRHHSPLLAQTLDAAGALGVCCQRGRASVWIAATIHRSPARSCEIVA